MLPPSDDLSRLTKAFMFLWIFPGAIVLYGSGIIDSAVDYLFADGALADPAFVILAVGGFFGPPMAAIWLDDQLRR